MPHIPNDAPFNSEQRSWLRGFIAGLNSQRLLSSTTVESGQSEKLSTLDILFGTQTGNAEELANEAGALASERGYKPRIRELDAIDMSLLAEMENAIVVISTYGEGEMPDNAGIFWEALSSSSAPRLDNLNYAVLGLGDTSYDEFCHAGKLIDTRLEQLGAVRIAQRIDCDVDYEEPSSSWLREVIKEAPQATGVVEKQSSSSNDSVRDDAVQKKSKWTKKNPYMSTIIENRLLSGSGSSKEIRHVSFDIASSHISYESGDALGVLPKNAPDLVQGVLDRLKINYEHEVDGYDYPMGHVLANNFEIMTPSRELIHEIERRVSDSRLSEVIGNKENLDKFLWGKDILDLLNLDPKLHFEAAEFVRFLKPLQHRAYSISSSPKFFHHEVHLTVAAVRWDYEGRTHKGVASTFIADQLVAGENAGVFLSPNKNFRIPKNDDVPMIMVGPGTGVAPFRAFLQEREARGSGGLNWLFFGDQHRRDDFLYEDEFNRMLKSGVLNRLDLAFSRDQEEKIYVQNRMSENGKSLFAALEEGGVFYVCGDATRMAKDVDQGLHEIIRIHGGLTPEATTEYVNKLKREKRYLRDVY